MTETELALVGRARAGDGDAFAQLYAPHERRLFQLAYRLTANREDAADVVQETLLRAYLRLGQFRGESSFGVWVRRVLVNACLDLLRRRKSRREVVLAPRNDLHNPLTDAPDPGAQAELEQLETRFAVVTALRLMPPEARLILALRDLEGYTQEEVAAFMDLPVGTVKSRHSRARRQARRIWLQMDRRTPAPASAVG